MFFKKSIKFNCLIPGVEKLMPIIPAKEYKHDWVRRAAKELSDIKKSPEYGMHKHIHTARCPGIFTLQRHGWILRTWQDITIETNGDSVTFNWTSPIDQKSLAGGIAFEAVAGHPPNQLRNYMENWPEHTLQTVVKINTPWRCMVPKGYNLLEIPVAYLDESRFTTLSGYFSHGYGPAPLNPQLFWHVLNGKTLIKAGTPIAQYLLVPKEQMEMEIESSQSTDQELLNLTHNHRFVRSYSEIKKLFGGEG